MTTRTSTVTEPAVRTVQGVRVPALGLGTWQLEGRACQEAVETALAIGYRHLDTAQLYGNEAAVGAGIAASGLDPAELFVTTKIASGEKTPAQVRASTEASLERLGLERVDLLLLHQPVADRPLAQALAEMAAMVAEGRVGGLGVSNFPLDLLEEAMAAVPLLAIQLEYHPMRAQDRQLAAARRHDLLFQAYSPLARGRAVDDAAVAGVAERLEATPAQVVLRWLLDQPPVAPIPKASSRRHLEENWAAQAVVLDDEARATLDALRGGERRGP